MHAIAYHLVLVEAARPAASDPEAPMIAALAWGLAAGCLARLMLGDGKPGVVVTLIGGLAGCVLGYSSRTSCSGATTCISFKPGLCCRRRSPHKGFLLLLRATLRRAGRRKRMFGCAIRPGEQTDVGVTRCPPTQQQIATACRRAGR